MMSRNDLSTLLAMLEKRLDPGAFSWLKDQCATLAAGAPERTLHLAFGMALRKAGRAPLAASRDEQAAASAVHAGWDLSDWTTDQAARAALLLALPATPASAKSVLALFQTADLGEHVALVRALFLLPDAGALQHIAREAIRSNMGDVFRAISQRNPYPAEHFDDIAWNQMIVKCLFVELSLAGVYALDKRANADLARMIAELARERWAAGRRISPEAWRCVAPFVDDPAAGRAREVLEKAFDLEPADRRGAALAAWTTGSDAARALVRAKASELVSSLEDGTLTWENHDRS
jgi:hypothetical protein